MDKGGDIADPANFRPISTLSAFTLIFEKLVYKQLNNYIEKYDILTQAIAEITDNLKNAIDNNLYTLGVFLDLAKAFETMNHDILFVKMEKYGIRGLPLKWFSNYLTNFHQHVSIDSTDSSYQTMICLWNSSRQLTWPITFPYIYK